MQSTTLIASDPPDVVRKTTCSKSDAAGMLDDADEAFPNHHPKNYTARPTTAYELRQSLIQRNLAFLHEPATEPHVASNDDGGGSALICDLRHESLNQILKQSIEIEKPSKFGGRGGDEDDTNNNHRDLLLGALDHHQHHHLDQHHHGNDGRDRDMGSKQSDVDRFAELMGDDVDLDGEKVSM